jgi:lipoyl(octanoyl) transferase
MTKSTWRLLHTPPAPGDWNMAVDEAILEAVGQAQSLPTLRLFAWQPPCLSLGYAQPVNDVDMDALRQRGWGLVRRPTGGRAILHTDELTYSVIAPLQEPHVYGSVLESYRRLSAGLLEALHLLGIPARADKEHTLPGAPLTMGPVCFEIPSNYEITVAGKKLIGSAQARRREGVLQHGSLPLFGDLARITEVLAFPDENARLAASVRLLERALTAADCLPAAPTWDMAAMAFCAGFENALDLELIPGELSNLESTRATQLLAEKYAHQSWTARV